MTDPAMDIYRENPPGPDWAARLTAALRAEYAGTVVRMPEPPVAMPKEPKPRSQAAPRERPVVIAVKRAPKPKAQRKPARPTTMIPPRLVAVIVPRLPECSGCGKPFGPDRPRDWAHEGICDSCATHVLVGVR